MPIRVGPHSIYGALLAHPQTRALPSHVRGVGFIEERFGAAIACDTWLAESTDKGTYIGSLHVSQSHDFAFSCRTTSWVP